MSHLSVFLNTEVKNKNTFDLGSAFGDVFLSPVRYFFNGRVVTNFNNQIGHEKAYKGKWYNFNLNFFDSSKGFLKTLLMVWFFAPGLITGMIMKSFAYLSKDIRENHDLAKKHFTPIDITIGSEEERLDENGIKMELEMWRKKDPLHRKVNNLIIYGNGNVQFNTDPGFVSMNPKKVVMVGAKIIHAPAMHRLDDELSDKKKWLVGGIVRECIDHLETQIANKVTFITHITQLKVSSVKEALDHKTPRRSFLSSKRYRAVYLVQPTS